MSRLRARIALLGLMSLALAASPAVASAQPFTTSTITAPASGSILFYDGDQGAGSVTVAGTVSPADAGFGDLLCYSTSNSPLTVADDIPVSATGAFAATVSLSAAHGQACALSFVPTGTTPTPAVAAVSFPGPTISVSDQYSYATNGALYGYDILAGSLPFTFELGSLGECPVRSSFSTDPATLNSYYLFDGNACLLQSSGADPNENTRSAVQVDGVNAFAPGAIRALTGDPGFVPLQYSASWSDGNEAVTSTETDALMTCPPVLLYPPTTSSCATLAPSGVQVSQTTSVLDGGQITRIVQRFTNTDGTRHQLDLLFSQSVRATDSTDQPGFEFPQNTAFATHAAPDALTGFPAGPGTIYVIADDADAPASVNPVGAITYGNPPDSADFVSAPGAQVGTFLMHYTVSLAPHGSQTFTWSLDQAASAAALTAIVRAERDRYLTPSLRLTSPRNRVTVSRSTVRVSGIASDPIGIGSVLVDGVRSAVRRGGHFTRRVALHPGVNRVTVVVANLGGVTRSAVRTVRFAPVHCRVPRLGGRTLAAAVTALGSAGCRVGAVHRHRSRTTAAGTVIATHPRAHARLAGGARVTLVVSAGV